MTIDEAIQRENKIAEENQKIVDTEIVYDDVSLSQLYCDDTEVIEEHLENYKKCAEYHKQLVDWLEELKDMRNLDKTNFSDGYNRGIDDFLKEADATFPMHSDGTPIYLDELQEDRGNMNIEVFPDCSIMCYLADDSTNHN